MALSRTYGNIQHKTLVSGKTPEKVWCIDQAEPHICIRLKSIFPSIGEHKIVPFHFPDTPENSYNLLWFMDRHPLAISDKDLARMKRGKKKYIDEINELEAIALPDYMPREVSLKEGFKARHYQLQAKDLLLKCKRLLVGDEVGLGKTLIGILACLEPQTLPAMVVVQTHLTKQWKQEIERFTNLSVHIINGTKPYSLPKADVYIIKYSCLSGWVDILGKGIFKMAIFDEIQELRHWGTQKHKGAQVLCTNVSYVLALSATPIYNYGNEIYTILDLIKQGCLGKYGDFLREWCTLRGQDKYIVKNPVALGTYLREKFLFIRRTREEVGRELPVINKIIHTVGYNEKIADEQEELTRMLAIKVVSGSFVERGQASRELDALMRHTTGLAKADEVAGYVKILLENNEPVLLAGWHRAVYERWIELLGNYSPVLYTGSETPVEKEKSKQAFISGDTNLMIISLRSGIGLDGLQRRCKTVVFGELDWSPQVHHQVIGRIDREGQTNQVTAIFLVTDSGSDPVIIDMLGLKSSQSHNIIDPLKAVPNQHSDESRIKVLAQQYLDKKSKETITA